MKKLAISLVEKRFCRAKKLNKTTRRILADIKKGKGLVRAKNMQELFRKLGI